MNHSAGTSGGLTSDVRSRQQDRGRPLGADGPVDIRRHVQQLSHWMDTAFEVPIVGWRFGWDALIGLVPGVGDVATTVVSIYIVALAAKVGLPRITVARMGLNVALDMLLGSLPLVGDLFDVWWKANKRNAALLAERLERGETHRRATAADWLFVAAVIGALVALFVAIVALAAMTVAALWNLAIG
jgi:hypothetical protein